MASTYQMLSPKRVKITEVNSHLVCVLCGGYFVEATTIVECLHTFCRSCIVKYVHQNRFCPICDVQLHHSKPWECLRTDKIIQDVVYKLVPGLYHNEMARRREFYSRMRGEPDVDDGEDRGYLPHGARFYAQDDSISLSLEYYSGVEEDEEGNDDQNLKSYRQVLKKKPKRYLQCPAAVTIRHLKKFLWMKYGVGVNGWVDILYNDESLPEDFSLIDVAYTYSWKRTSPMRLSYRIFSKMTVRTMEPEVDVQNSVVEGESSKTKQQPSLEQQRKQSEYLENLNLNPTNAKLCKNQTQSKSASSGEKSSHSDDKQNRNNDKPIKSSDKQKQTVGRSILKNGNDYDSNKKNKIGLNKNKNKSSSSSSNNNNNTAVKNNNTASEKKSKRDETHGKSVTIFEHDKIYHPCEDSSSSSQTAVRQKENLKGLSESMGEPKSLKKSSLNLTCLEEETVDSFTAKKFLRSQSKYEEKKEKKKVEEEPRGEKRRRSTSCIEGYAEDKRKNPFKRRKSVAADEYSQRRENETKTSKNFPDPTDDEESNGNLKSEALRKVFVSKEKPDGGNKKDSDGWRMKRKKSKDDEIESKRRKSEDEPKSPSILTFASDPLKMKVKLNQNKSANETPNEEPGKLKKKEVEKKERICEVTARNVEKDDKESGNRKEEREKRERNESKDKIEKRETREKDKIELREKVDKKEIKEKMERREFRDRAAKKDGRDKGNKKEVQDKADRKEDKEKPEKKETREKPYKSDDRERVDKKGNKEKLDIKESREKADKKEDKNKADKKEDQSKADRKEDKNKADRKEDQSKADKKEDKNKADKKEDQSKADKKEDKNKADKKEDKNKADKKEDREKADKKETRDKVNRKEDIQKIDKKETREKVNNKKDEDNAEKNVTREKSDKNEDKIDETQAKDKPHIKEEKDKENRTETEVQPDKTVEKDKVDKSKTDEKQDRNDKDRTETREEVKIESRENIDNRGDEERVEGKNTGEKTYKKEATERVDIQEHREKVNEEEREKIDTRYKVKIEEGEDKEKVDETESSENIEETEDQEKVEKRKENEEAEKTDVNECKERRNEEKERLDKMKDKEKEKQELQIKETKKPTTTTAITPVLQSTITITPVTMATTTTTCTATADTTTISTTTTSVTTITKTSTLPPSSLPLPSSKERLLHLRQVRHKNVAKTSVTEIISAPPSLTISKVDSSEPPPVKTPVNDSKPSLEIVLVNPPENTKSKKKTQKKSDAQIKFIEPPDGDTPADIFEGVLDLSGKSSRPKDTPPSSNSESNLPAPARENHAVSHTADSSKESETAEKSSRKFFEIAQTLVSRKMLSDNQFNPFEGPSDSAAAAAAAAAAAMRNLKTLSDTAVDILMAAQNKNFGAKSETSNRPSASAALPASSKPTTPTNTSTKPEKDCDIASGLKIPSFSANRERPIPPVPNLQQIYPRGRGRPRPLTSTSITKPGQNQTVRQIPNPFAILSRHSSQNQNALRSMLFSTPEEESTPSLTSKQKQIPPLQSIRSSYPPPLMSDVNRFPYEALGPKIWDFNGSNSPRGFPTTLDTSFRGVRNGDERYSPIRYNAPNTSMRRMEQMTKSIESVAAGLTARATSNPMVDAK